jgi:hypothetical protein
MFIMSSQEELARCLRQLTEALGPNRARRLSIVRDGDKSRIAGAKDGHDQDVVTAAKPTAAT